MTLAGAQGGEGQDSQRTLKRHDVLRSNRMDAPDAELSERSRAGQHAIQFAAHWLGGTQEHQ